MQKAAPLLFMLTEEELEEVFEEIRITEPTGSFLVKGSEEHG